MIKLRSLLRYAGAALLAAALVLSPVAFAAVPNVTPGAGQVSVLAFHISGQYTATTANVAKFNLPFPATLLGVSATARASGGTTPTLTVDLKEAGVTVLSAPIAITALTVSEGTITDSVLADEASMTVDLTIGGSSPTWNDITILVTVFRN